MLNFRIARVGVSVCRGVGVSEKVQERTEVWVFRRGKHNLMSAVRSKSMVIKLGLLAFLPRYPVTQLPRYHGGQQR